MLIAATPPPAHVVVAKHDRETVVRVGDLVLMPLYDAKRPPNESGDALQFVGEEYIGMHDLWEDSDFNPVEHPDMPRGAYDAASGLAASYVAKKAGHAAATVYLTLPNLAERCVDCRVIHYFIQVKQR